MNVYFVGPTQSGKIALLSSLGSVFNSPERTIGSERTLVVRKSTVHQNGTPLTFNFTLLNIEHATRLKKGEADLLIFLADSSESTSIEQLLKYLEKCESPSIGNAFVLTKADLVSEVDPKQIARLMKEKGFLFFLETSSVKRWNTEELLTKLAQTF